MLPCCNKTIAIVFLGLLPLVAGCKSEEPQEDPRQAQLQGATAVGGFVYNDTTRITLNAQQATEALNLIKYCYEVRPDRESTTYPGTALTRADMGISVTMKLEDDTEDEIALGYYAGEEVIAIEGGNFKKTPDDDKVITFVQGITGSPAAQ